MYETIDELFFRAVQYCILVIEFIGVAVLVFTVLKCALRLRAKRSAHIRLDLAEGIALSLEFKMGSELLRTVVVRELRELLILGAVILLRAALAFFICWEITNEKKASAIPPEDNTLDKSNSSGYAEER
ncbi:MAG: DUF1622 domain-containing protein [Eubacteriales bacterium]